MKFEFKITVDAKAHDPSLPVDFDAMQAALQRVLTEHGVAEIAMELSNYPVSFVAGIDVIDRSSGPQIWSRVKLLKVTGQKEGIILRRGYDKHRGEEYWVVATKDGFRDYTVYAGEFELL